MKVVCLTKSNPRLNYFINKVNEQHNLHLVIVESLPFNWKRVKLLIKTYGFLRWMFKAFKVRVERIIAPHTPLYEAFLENKWQKIDPKISTLIVPDINNSVVAETLKREKPDLVIVNGTSLVKEHVFDTVPLSLNLHAGLSPYYRGTHCTDWALINWDPYNIGMTMHKVAKVIDGGDILGQRRVSVVPNDTRESIDIKIIREGVSMTLEAINRLKSKTEMKFHKQNLSLGYIKNLEQFNDYLLSEIKFIEKKGLIAEMLKRPSRKEKLPIISM